MSQKSFCELLEEERKVRAYGIAEKLRERTDAGSITLDPLYVTDVRGYVKKAIDGNQQEYRIVPSDLLYEYDRDDALVVFQEIVRMFGRLLEEWPDIVKNAPDMQGLMWECH